MSSACALAGGISGSHKRVRACCLLFTLFVCAQRSVRFWSCAAGVALTELCDERAEPHNLCNSARCRQAAHSVVCVRQPPERERHLQAGSSTGRPLLSRCVRLSPSTHLHSQCQGLAVAHLCHKGGGHAQAVRCVTESQPSHAATPSFSAQWQPVRANRQARCSRGVPATCTALQAPAAAPRRGDGSNSPQRAAPQPGEPSQRARSAQRLLCESPRRLVRRVQTRPMPAAWRCCRCTPCQHAATLEAEAEACSPPLLHASDTALSVVMKK